MLILKIKKNSLEDERFATHDVGRKQPPVYKGPQKRILGDGV